jgi:hypothetical protein
MPSVRLRFVDTNDSLVSRVICGVELGPAYSHVEAVTPEGRCLGALTDSGAPSRPSSYDTTWSQQLFSTRRDRPASRSLLWLPANQKNSG